MISVNLWRFLQIFTSILLLTPSFSQNDRKTYIVYMGDHPKGVKSTELLHTSMIQNVLGSNFAPNALLHSYKNFNGFVVRLTEEETMRMRGMNGVVSVIPNTNHQPQTSKSWDFIGFPETVKRSNVESNLVIGVIDSGIWPESDSFSGTGFGPPPNKWKGSCRNFTCNNKIVGARYVRLDGKFEKDDEISPRDTMGHGTHCASIAAGNPVKGASLFGLGAGTARGGVPSARIAVYKVCWSTGCKGADILAAFDEAIADGVDILSVSLGPKKVRHNDYFHDIYAVGAFHAMKKGILTSKSADNSGPQPYSISNIAPWFISVAASSIDRKFLTNVQLGDGRTFQGVSINTFDLKNRSYALIYAGEAPNIAGGYNSSTSRSCPENSLDKDLVKGKIVLCDYYRGPKSVGFASEAAGIIFRSRDSKVLEKTYALPAVHLNQNDGTHIYSYIKSSRNPTATIFKSIEGKDSLAPYIASFSSRGPNKITPDILKPDIAAPGVNILAAWPPIASISGIKGDTRTSNYQLLPGTSMACPHVSAAAAYVKSFHPNWSPAMVKSALMTTATSMRVALNEEAEFAYGAGQINPVKAVNPGLVYDAGEIDYIKFLCGQGYDTSKLRILTGDNSSCTKANNGTVWDLNLPSFTLSTILSKNTNVIFSRTVTNVGSATSRYKAKITTHPSSLNIKVEPDTLLFSSLGEKKSFKLKIEGHINADKVSFALVWDDGTFQVKSPVVVYVPPP